MANEKKLFATLLHKEDISIIFGTQKNGLVAHLPVRLRRSKSGLLKIKLNVFGLVAQLVRAADS